MSPHLENGEECDAHEFYIALLLSLLTKAKRHVDQCNMNQLHTEDLFTGMKESSW